jgi:hypothetical protein
VPEYRAYIVGSDGHFETVRIIKASDDEHAIAAARQYVNGRSVELWELDRQVAVLHHEN